MPSGYALGQVYGNVDLVRLGDLEDQEAVKCLALAERWVQCNLEDGATGAAHLPLRALERVGVSVQRLVWSMGAGAPGRTTRNSDAARSLRGSRYRRLMRSYLIL